MNDLSKILFEIPYFHMIARLVVAFSHYLYPSTVVYENVQQVRQNKTRGDKSKNTEEHFHFHQIVETWNNNNNNNNNTQTNHKNYV